MESLVDVEKRITPVCKRRINRIIASLPAGVPKISSEINSDSGNPTMGAPSMGIHWWEWFGTIWAQYSEKNNQESECAWGIGIIRGNKIGFASHHTRCARDSGQDVYRESFLSILITRSFTGESRTPPCRIAQTQETTLQDISVPCKERATGTQDGFHARNTFTGKKQWKSLLMTSWSLPQCFSTVGQLLQLTSARDPRSRSAQI